MVRIPFKIRINSSLSIKEMLAYSITSLPLNHTIGFCKTFTSLFSIVHHERVYRMNLDSASEKLLVDLVPQTICILTRRKCMYRDVFRKVCTRADTPFCDHVKPNMKVWFANLCLPCFFERYGALFWFPKVSSCVWGSDPGFFFWSNGEEMDRVRVLSNLELFTQKDVFHHRCTRGW